MRSSKLITTAGKASNFTQSNLQHKDQTSSMSRHSRWANVLAQREGVDIYTGKRIENPRKIETPKWKESQTFVLDSLKENLAASIESAVAGQIISKKSKPSINPEPDETTDSNASENEDTVKTGPKVNSKFLKRWINLEGKEPVKNVESVQKLSKPLREWASDKGDFGEAQTQLNDIDLSEINLQNELNEMARARKASNKTISISATANSALQKATGDKILDENPKNNFMHMKVAGYPFGSVPPTTQRTWSIDPTEAPPPKENLTDTPSLSSFKKVTEKADQLLNFFQRETNFTGSEIKAKIKELNKGLAVRELTQHDTIPQKSPPKPKMKKLRKKIKKKISDKVDFEPQTYESQGRVAWRETAKKETLTPSRISQQVEVEVLNQKVMDSWKKEKIGTTHIKKDNVIRVKAKKKPEMFMEDLD